MAEKAKWTHGMGIGCLLQIVLLAALDLALSYDAMVSALAYLLLLLPLALFVRWLLHRGGMLNGLGGSLYGPAIVCVVAALAIKRPIHVKDEDGADVVATPRVLADRAAKKVVDVVGPDAGKADGAASKDSGGGEPKEAGGAQIPPGVSYTAAPENAGETLEDVLKELDGLIGLKEVKQEVAKFARIVQVNKMREAEGLKVPKVSYHMVFTGNPGTGKTTVARIMARVYRALGIVKKGHLVETDRGGLIAGYVGQTAEKTAKVIDFALDGVLFIDEAYAITEGDGENGYGAECIATLLKRMEDNRDRLVVIVAGYTDEMKRFIDANPGLESRFNRYIHFPDYSAEELADIFRMRAKSAQYVLSDDVERWIVPYIALKTKDRDRKFGNGRWVRNLFEKTIERQAMRLAEFENPTREQLMTITMKDVGISLKDPDASAED